MQESVNLSHLPREKKFFAILISRIIIERANLWRPRRIEMQQECPPKRRKEALECCISSSIGALPYSNGSHARARTILLTRFKWIVVKLRDSSAKQPRPVAILLSFPILKSSWNGSEWLSHLGRLPPPGKKHRRPLSSDSIREHLRVNASPLDYIRGHVRCRQKEKSPWETKWRKTQYARVRERRQNCGRGLKLKKGRRKRVRLSLSFRVKRVKNRGGDTFILGALGLYPLKRLAQNNVEKHIRSL